jgi:two-component system sensor histidine kinase LytS
METAIWMDMLQRLSVVTTFAFILSHTGIFRRLVSQQRVKAREWWILTVIFGLAGIAGSYAGVPVDGALANSRAVGVMAAGLIGGPLMGMVAALIAGIHRYLLGGFAGFAGGFSNVLEALLAGCVYLYYPARPIPWWLAFVSGVVGEGLQMVIILVMARPFQLAVELVRNIALPMMIINPLGLAIVMLIIKSAIDAEEKVGSEKYHKVLEIATKTLPYLRRGLKRDSAAKTAGIIYDVGDYDAVAVTDTEKVLAFVGAEAAHHGGDNKGLMKATLLVLDTAVTYIAQSQEEIGCSRQGCRLASAIVVPLKRADRVIGTLKLYYTRSNMIGDADVAFAEGVAHLFSTQLELAEIDRQAKLASRAELKALYAQINPHFFFNTLNTITSLVRTEPDIARELLVKLGVLFRMTMHKTGKNITIAEELDHVRAYLAIEKARHGDRLVIHEEIAEEALGYLIPSLTIQPLVENSIKHGLQPKEDGGFILLKIAELSQCIEICVVDNGVGIDLSKHHPLKQPAGESIGLVNVHERLRGMYGQGLNIHSAPGQGTSVRMQLPKQRENEGEEFA